MSQQAPRAVVRSLIALFAASFVLSVHLETYELRWLQEHPIMVNLLSGIVGFSAAFLVVAIVFNWFAMREQIDDLTHKAFSGISELMRELNRGRIHFQLYSEFPALDTTATDILREACRKYVDAVREFAEVNEFSSSELSTHLDAAERMLDSVLVTNFKSAQFDQAVASLATLQSQAEQQYRLHLGSRMRKRLL